MNYTARKQAKVTAQNRVNAFVNKATPLLLEAFRPFVGQVVLLSGGDKFLVKVRNAIAGVVATLNIENPSIRWRFEFQRYSIVLRADASERDEDGITHYQEQFQYLLDMLNTGVIKGLYDDEQHKANHKADWTVEAVEATRKEINTLKGRASSLESEICVFARFDS